MERVLVYTVHKAASMFLHKLTTHISADLSLPYYSVNKPDQFDEVMALSWSNFIEAHPERACFGPIRAGETIEIFPDNLDDYSIILHLRDPRDVLTSWYYSCAFSHPRREGCFNPSDEQRARWIDMGIDDFVLEECGEFKSQYTRLTSTLLGRKNVKLVKYEDMVCRYDYWLSEFISGFKSIKPPPHKILGLIPVNGKHEKIERKLYNKFKHEFSINRPEDIFRHKRQISPGDHVNKLAGDTIRVLNREFEAILDLLSYEEVSHA